jgi:hypothetical protein
VPPCQLACRDRDRTQRLTEQLVDKLQQSVSAFVLMQCVNPVPCRQVRAAPVPVTWLTREEESLLSAQVPHGASCADMQNVAQQLCVTMDTILCPGWPRLPRGRARRGALPVGGPQAPGWGRGEGVLGVMSHPPGRWERGSVIVTPSHLVLARSGPCCTVLY